MEQKVSRQNIETSDLPKFLCKQSKPATRLCCSTKCTSSGLLFSDQNCECNAVAHGQCCSLILKNVCQKINSTRKQIPQSVLKSFQTIDKIIGNILQELSILRENIEKKKDNYGLQQNTLQFLTLLYGLESESDKINGKLVSSVQSQLQGPKQPYYASEDEINHSWKQNRQSFDKLCSWFKNISDKNWVNSKITKQFPLLYDWIQQQMSKEAKSHKLLYRASENDFSVQKFHEKCDNIPNTLVIVRTEFGKIIGGFNPAMWNQVNGNYYSESRAFIFSLSLKDKMTNAIIANSIYCNSGYGPTFGAGHDLCIRDEANINQSSQGTFPTSYSCQLKYASNQKAHTLFTGATYGSKFRIEQWEIFQIDF